MKYKEFYKDITEDYPSNWNIDEFKSLNSFSKRIRYCDTVLQKLGAGSARIVYRIDNEKVLKLAKNDKGIAQNSVERDWYVQSSYSDVVAKVFDVDENDLWLEMELAQKLKPSRFKQIVGIDVKDVGMYLLNKDAEDNGRHSRWSVNPTIQQQLDENEWVQQVYMLCREIDLSPGDFGRLSSFGEVLRNGNPTAVVIDMGLSKSVYNDFYKIN
jgi:hypothetical protein